jgi:hypothetical protein
MDLSGGMRLTDLRAVFNFILEISVIPGRGIIKTIFRTGKPHPCRKEKG